MPSERRTAGRADDIACAHGRKQKNLGSKKRGPVLNEVNVKSNTKNTIFNIFLFAIIVFNGVNTLVLLWMYSIGCTSAKTKTRPWHTHITVGRHAERKRSGGADDSVSAQGAKKWKKKSGSQSLLKHTGITKASQKRLSLLFFFLSFNEVNNFLLFEYNTSTYL